MSEQAVRPRLPDYIRAANLWHKYKMRPEEYDAMREAQGYDIPPGGGRAERPPPRSFSGGTMDNRELLVDRITERIRTTPLHYSVAGNTRPTLPDDPHDEHDYLWDCLVCRAKDMPGALRMLVAEIVAQALGDA